MVQVTIGSGFWRSGEEEDRVVHGLLGASYLDVTPISKRSQNFTALSELRREGFWASHRFRDELITSVTTER